jgi:hypothetical protein
VNWSSDSPIDATGEKKKIATLLFCFFRWATEYHEIESRSPSDIICACDDYEARIDDKTATLTDNRYLGIIAPEYKIPKIPECPAEIEFGKKLSRFVLMADAHIGPTYHNDEYGWLDKLDDQLIKIHKESPIDFVAQLGDNSDDGYPKNYERDYGIYLEKIKKLSLLDPENPIKNTLLLHFYLRKYIFLPLRFCARLNIA